MENTTFVPLFFISSVFSLFFFAGMILVYYLSTKGIAVLDNHLTLCQEKLDLITEIQQETKDLQLAILRKMIVME